MKFTVYNTNGKEAIKVKLKDKGLYDSVVREVFGGAPVGHDGLCYDSPERAQQQILEEC